MDLVRDLRTWIELFQELEYFEHSAFLYSPLVLFNYYSVLHFNNGLLNYSDFCSYFVFTITYQYPILNSNFMLSSPSQGPNVPKPILEPSRVTPSLPKPLVITSFSLKNLVQPNDIIDNSWFIFGNKDGFEGKGMKHVHEDN